MPPRRRFDKRRAKPLSAAERTYGTFGFAPSVYARRGRPELAGEWAAWNAEHGDAWRVRYGVAEGEPPGYDPPPPPGLELIRE